MKILNFGSLNSDYVYTVRHFVRPGETLKPVCRNVFPGGKGLNQSVALARAGAEVYHAGAVGTRDGLFLKQMLSENGVHTEFVQELDAPGGHAVIQVDASGQNCILLYGGANMMIEKKFVDAVLSHFSAGDFLLLQNEINAIPYIMQKAAERGMHIFFNPSPYTKDIEQMPLSAVDCFLLNELEARDMCGIAGKSGLELLYAVNAKFPAAQIVLTLGDKGVLYKDSSFVCHHGVYEVSVADTTAAGDTFTGYFAGCIAQNMDKKQALMYASVAASLAVSRKGAASSIPLMHEVKNARLKPAAAKRPD